MTPEKASTQLMKEIGWPKDKWPKTYEMVLEAMKKILEEHTND